ncbi:MAG: N-methyl-L-tryptophan oxidase [Pseudomarimonas sp.]
MTSPMQHDVIIVGLGAMGSAAACQLARRGAKVLGLDRYTPPHAFGSSHGQSRIIRTAYFEHPAYVPLLQRAWQLWMELEQLSASELLRPTGGLMIGPRDGVLVAGVLRSARQHGLAHELLDADALRERYPALRPDPDMQAVWEPAAGVLLPEACIEAQLRVAHAHGAELRFGEVVTHWQQDGDGVRVFTSQGEYRGKQLLLTTGAWIGSLAPSLANSFTVERQVLYWFDAVSDRTLFTPERCPIHLWETHSQRFFYGFPDMGSGIKLAIHHEGQRCDPDRLNRDVSTTEIAAIRALLARYLPAANGALRAAEVCMYTNSNDEHFWIDRLPQQPAVLVASACSGHGFKFASVLGEVLADLLIEGRSRFDLSLFKRR